MFNLIRRDLILQKKQLLFFIPIVLLFIITDKHPAFIYIVASFFIPFNTYAYDEKVQTNILLNSLPYTRNEIISARYVGAVLYMALSIALTSLLLFILDTPFTLNDIAIGSSLFLLFASFTFPLFYILKPGYIFTTVLISFLLLAAVGPKFVLFLAEHLTALTNFITSLSEIALYIGAGVVTVALYSMSWGISSIIYQRKAF